jgi:hypothetical protein
MSSADTHAPLESLMERLMAHYKARVPDVDRVLQELVREGVIARGSDIENDHIAFRSLAVPNLGIASLEKVFLRYGYVKRDYYYFAEKKLDAYWYSPPHPRFPRIFISELRVGELSPAAQVVIRKYTDAVTSDPTDGIALDDPAAADAFLHRALWATPSWSDYELLARESEYASWVMYNRYYLNHFTVSVHNLPAGYATIDDFNAFLLRRGFRLNNSGGLQKVSPDGLLLQSSTVAELVTAEFGDGIERQIPGSYVEFAERRVFPQFAHLPAEQIGREHRRDGFEASNADRIFESTYDAQTRGVHAPS